MSMTFVRQLVAAYRIRWSYGARRNFGEHGRSVRIVLGHSLVRHFSAMSAIQITRVHHNSQSIVS